MTGRPEQNEKIEAFTQATRHETLEDAAWAIIFATHLKHPGWAQAADAIRELPTDKGLQVLTQAADFCSRMGGVNLLMLKADIAAARAGTEPPKDGWTPLW